MLNNTVTLDIDNNNRKGKYLKFSYINLYIRKEPLDPIMKDHTS